MNIDNNNIRIYYQGITEEKYMKKKYFFVLSFMVYLVSMLYSQKNGLFKTEIEKNTIIITGFTGKDKDIVIPDTIDSVPVRAIGEFAFDSLTSVTLPEGLVSIRIGAFSSNQLTSVVIPESVLSIEDIAFSDNQLISVIIPENVLSIGHGAFENNKLQEIVLPPHITSIRQLSFANNQLKNIIIPDKVTYIMDGAFADNQFEEIIIPNSVVEIGTGAFENNPLKKITIGSDVELYGRPFEELFCLFYIKHGKKAGTYIKSNEAWSFLNEENNGIVE
jgi:hypothetical protein